MDCFRNFQSMENWLCSCFQPFILIESWFIDLMIHSIISHRWNNMVAEMFIFAWDMINNFLFFCRYAFNCFCRFPFYYELKIIFVIWLMLPFTNGASIMFRFVILPQFSKWEKVHTMDRLMVLTIEILHQLILWDSYIGLNQMELCYICIVIKTFIYYSSYLFYSVKFNFNS